jgi:alkylation response protein AidB-like acyl-CoA dehydrogenase
MACWPLATFGTVAQKERWLPEMLGGTLLGGYCLSEADAGSDPGAMRARARRENGHFRDTGSKAWVTHGGEADFYTLFARTSDDARRGFSCFLAPGQAEGVSRQEPEH